MRILNITMLALTLSLNACAQKTEIKKMQSNSNTKNTSVKTFVDGFSDFKMDIEGAGLATIPKATISDKGELYIEYAYYSESENRKGKMTLSENANHRFEGNWKTIADNGNVYQGSLYFDFKTSGEANGYYKFAGSDYKITIFIPVKK